MDVVVFGATGNIGRAIVAELVARDHQVTGISRSGVARADLPAGVDLRAGDVTDPTEVSEAVRGRDAVISAIGPASGSDETQPFVAAAHGLVEGVRRAGVSRLLVVGGAGSLEVAPGVQAVDAPDFPEAYRPNALAQREALQFYRTVDDLDWTYISTEASFSEGAVTKQVRKTVREVFEGFESGSIQQIIYQIGEKMLAEIPAIGEIHLEANNRTWDTIAESGLSLGIYTDARPPYGILGLTLKR